MRTLAERSAHVFTGTLVAERADVLADRLAAEAAADLVIRDSWAPCVDHLVVGRAGVFLVAVAPESCGRIPFSLRADLREQVARARAALDARGLVALPVSPLVCAGEPVRPLPDIAAGDIEAAIELMTSDRRFGTAIVQRAVAALAPIDMPPFVADIAAPAPSRRRLLDRVRA